MWRRRALAALALTAMSGLSACNPSPGTWGHSISAGFGSCVATLTHSLNAGSYFQAQTIRQANCTSVGARLVYVHFDGFTYVNSWDFDPTHASSLQHAVSSPRSEHLACLPSACGQGTN